MQTANGASSPYRWIMALLVWLMFFALGLSWFSFAPIMLEAMDELSITFEEAGIVIGLVPLALVIVCIPSGLLADRFSLRKTVLVGATVMSVFGMLRGFSFDFATLAMTMFACGVGYAVSYPSLSKVIGVWFPPKEIALAMGIVFSGMEVGMSASLLLTPAMVLAWSGSWRYAFIAIGALTLAITLVWTVLAREVPESRTRAPGERPKAESSSLKNSFFTVARNRHIWIVSLIGFMLLGSQVGFIGFFPSLLELRGIDPTTAGIIASTVPWFMVPGSLVIPKTSDRTGVRKPFFWLASIAAGAALYFAAIDTGRLMWVSIIVYGFLSGGMAALALSTTVELAGQSQAATATGLFLVVGYLGALFGPWLVGLLASTTGSFIMSISACVVLTETIVILGLSLKETGKRPVSGKRSKDGTTRAAD